MFRDGLTLLVAFAVTLFALDPNAGAQFASAPDPQYQQQQDQAAPQAGQYPSISQDQDQQAAAPTDQAVAGPDGAPPSNPEQDAAADQKHAVARLSIVQGDVNVRRAPNAELTAGTINAPLLTGDHVQTGDGSRAEVELDAANLVRLAPDTEVGFSDLEYQKYGVQLGAGTIIFRVLRNSNAMREVDTPSIGFRPLSEGEFRLSVLQDGTTQITARSGQAEIFGPRGAQSLPAGQTVLVRGNAGDPEFRNIAEIGRDQLDDWSARRDAQLSASSSYRYVSPDVPGADDLDQYGQWVPSQYGQVWTPQNEPSGWSPYSTGEWAWQDYYGWTWVDSAPWGWAPYHYGRWFYNGGYGWCWWPGGLRTAFWSPALVGFFGWGGLGVSIGLGGLGWCALAPFEAFHRWWGPGWGGRGWGYGSWGGRGFRPYVVHNVNVTNVYRNAGYRGGAMTAAYNGFGGPHQRFSQATRAQLTGATSFRGGQLPVSPSHSSSMFSNRSVTANPRLATASNQHFFQSTQFRQSSPARSVAGFQPQTAARGVTNGSAFHAAGPSTSLHGVAPNMSNGAAARSNGAAVSGRQSSNGWQRFGDPGNGAALRQGFMSGSGSTSAQQDNGWHHFGQPRQGSATAPSFNGANGYRAPSSPAYGSGRTTTPAYNGQQQRYSAPAYNNAPRSYSTPSYSSQPRYSTPAYNSAPRSYSAPSYGGGSRSYSAPSYSAPHYSAPSSGSHSYGSSGGSSYHGSSGGGGGSSHSSGGGAGHSSGGGGGHSGGGGGHHR